jgi:hypothetical protein
MEKPDYRPAHIEFDVAPDGSPVPESLGNFENADECLLFMQKNFFSTNTGLTVNRFMDNFEKAELRKQYNDILENVLPKFEQEMRNAIDEFNHAKTNKDNAIEMVSAYINEAKAIAVEVKRGLIDMKLDELFTWKLPYKNRFYYFTFIDNQVRLVRISDMTDHEKTELFSQGKVNEEIFDNGEVKPQAGEKKQLRKKSE